MQATYLMAEVLIRVIHVPLVMEKDKTNIGTEAELFPACIAGNRAATIRVLHLEEAAGNAHSKLEHPGPPTAVTASPGLQVAGP